MLTFKVPSRNPIGFRAAPTRFREERGSHAAWGCAVKHEQHYESMLFSGHRALYGLGDFLSDARPLRVVVRAARTSILFERTIAALRSRTTGARKRQARLAALRALVRAVGHEATDRVLAVFERDSFQLVRAAAAHALARLAADPALDFATRATLFRAAAVRYAAEDGMMTVRAAIEEAFCDLFPADVVRRDFAGLALSSSVLESLDLEGDRIAASEAASWAASWLANGPYTVAKLKAECRSRGRASRSTAPRRSYSRASHP